MSGRSTSLPDDYFDAIYRACEDPWRYRDSDYERRKYDRSIEVLGGRRFRHGFEVGCSIGVLTRRLALCCDRLLAIDVSEQALRHAKTTCADLLHVEIRRARAPRDWPPGAFDLIVLSEVLYYLSETDVVETARLSEAALEPDGMILLVHWTGETDYPLTGDAAADLFLASVEAAFGSPKLQIRAPLYRLDLLARPPLR